MLVFNCSAALTFTLLKIRCGIPYNIILKLQDGQDDAKQSTADMTAFVSSLTHAKICD